VNAPRSGGSRGRADLHLHSLYSDGTSPILDILDWIEYQTDLDLVAITDHERIDGAVRAREIHGAGDYHFDFVVGEEITTRRGHILGLFLTERVPALRPMEETIERIHAQGGLAVAAHPMAPLTPSLGRRSLLQLHNDPRPDHRLDAIEVFNPTEAGRTRRAHLSEMNEALLGLPGVGNSDAHVLWGIGTAWTWFEGTDAAAYRAALASGAVEADGTDWPRHLNAAVYARQLLAKSRHLGHTLRPRGEWR